MRLSASSVLAVFLSFTAFAQDSSAPPPVPTLPFPKHPTRMEKALAISISPSGQKYFEDHLGEIFARNGIAIDAGIYELLNFSYDGFLLSKATEKPGPEAEAVMKLIEKVNYLTVGLDLNPTQPHVQIQNLMYMANAKMSVRPDWAAMDANPNSGAISLISSLKFSEFELFADAVRLSDLGNPALKTWGINQFGFSMVPGTQPFDLQIPVEIKVARDRSITATAKSITTNIDQVEFQLPNQIDLKTPQVGLQIGKAKGKIDFSEIGVFVDKKKGALLKALQSSMKAFVTEKLPSKMNREVSQGYNPNDPEVDLMDPPGAPLDTPVEKYRFGIQLSDLKATKDRLLIAELSANIDDPIRIKTPLPPSRPIAVSPAFDGDAHASDLSFALKETLVNRALQLSFLRGYFDEVPLGGGEFLKLVSAPTILLEQVRNTDLIPLSVDANYQVDGFFTKALAVKNPLHMRFNINVQIKKTGNTVKLVQHSIDTSTLWINPASLRKFGFKKKVYKTVRAMMEGTNKDWAKTETLLANEVLIPQSFYGIPLALDHFKANDGYIYLHFKLTE